VTGPFGDVVRDILKGCCVPVLWFQLDRQNPAVLHNASMTLVTSSKATFGVTAAHVERTFAKHRRDQRVRLQIFDAVVDDLLERAIAISDGLDLATIGLGSGVLSQLGKDVVPLRTWPPLAPAPGRGIMLAGYPGQERLNSAPLEVDFGLFTVLGIARSVSDEQITWVVERDYGVDVSKIPTLPRNSDLGGISGGPLVGWFESPNHLATYRLSGIISQAHAGLERVIAKRADFIRDDGTIQEPR
jgi:hypothetical protein